MFDLATEDGRKQLAKQIKADFDEASVKLYREGPRAHLGASVIGEPCSRKLYAGFRWCWPTDDQPEGRMLRLFNRGKFEEPRVIAHLRAIGFEVFEYEKRLCYHPESDSYFTLAWDKPIDPSVEDVTGFEFHIKRAKAGGLQIKQHRITSEHGHFGGSQDAYSIAPERYGLGQEKLLNEYKTVNGAWFKKLIETESVAEIYPKYYAQVCEYGYKNNYKYAIFVFVNKNDDDIYIEVVALNHRYGETLAIKADEIIFAKGPPPRISENSADWHCKTCAFTDGCFHGKPVEKNCRSCQHSEPIGEAKWKCNNPLAGNGTTIPDDFIPQGCDQHLGITFT